MERKTALAEGEHYHIYSRGVEKRKIFLNTKDYTRFVALLYIMNQNASFRMENFLRDKENNLKNIFQKERGKSLVSILSYCLMPNHFHIVLYEHTPGGISKFMGKALTAYSMYFNAKYERSGPLFTRPFRSEHIDNDPQYLYIFSYLHLNPLSIFDKKWKKNGLKNKKEAENFLQNYSYSSYLDFLGKSRSEVKILDFSLVPNYIRKMKLNFKTLEKTFREQGESLLS